MVLLTVGYYAFIMILTLHPKLSYHDGDAFVLVSPQVLPLTLLTTLVDLLASNLSASGAYCSITLFSGILELTETYFNKSLPSYSVMLFSLSTIKYTIPHPR